MKIKITFTLSLLLTACTINMWAQTANDLSKMSRAKKLKMADYLYNSGSLYNAVLYYQSEFEDDNTNAYVASQIATAEYSMRDYKQAEKWYKILNNLKAPNYPQAAYYVGLMQKYNGKYDEAKKTFESFQRNYKQPDAGAMKKQARNQIRGCDLAIDMLANPNPKVRVSHLGTQVNAPFTEMSPVSIGDTVLLYASLKSDSLITIGGSKKRTTTQFYVSHRKDSTYSASTVYDAPYNDNNVNEGNGAYNAQGNHFFFSRAVMDNNLKYHSDLYMSEYKNGKWTSGEKLPAPINDPAYNTTQPTVENDKNGEVIYFSSDRTDGMGGYDIWYTVRSNEGSYSKPTNAGKKINTPGNEITPFYETKSGILYYSSDGEVGIGGYDVFRSKGTLAKFANPENLGYPINSSCDDMYFTLDTKRNRGGYVVSNRPGTISVKSETCCDDIWRVDFIRTIHYAVRGYVYDEADPKKTPIDGQVILLNNAKQLGTDVAQPNKPYFFSLLPSYTYAFKVAKAGYYTASEVLQVQPKADDDTVRLDIAIKKIPPVPPRHIINIYYGFDSAIVENNSGPAIDSLYNFLIDNPSTKVEISSHTDSKGNPAYNMKLSQSRAESVVNIMISRGISKDRLVAKGYGATMPIAPNTLPNGKDNPEGRAKNRRTEFKITGEIANTQLIYEKGDPNFNPAAQEKVDNGDDIKFYQIDKDKNEKEDKDIDNTKKPK